MIMLMNDVRSVWTAMLCQSVRQAIAAAAAATVASNRSLARHASCFYTRDRKESKMLIRFRIGFFVDGIGIGNVFPWWSSVTE